MSREIYCVDAFADAPFAGNPAAVCLVDTAVDDRWMQSVAAEMNLSETAFLVPLAEQGWGLRWFTPALEVDLCGHATLASAHVLWCEIGVEQARLRFHTRSGWLTADLEDRWISLDFPADSPEATAPPSGLVAALGAEPESVYRGRNKLLVVLSDADAVRDLEPDMRRVAELDVTGVMVTAQSDGQEYDFVSRFFAPRAGIPEDPVTGSAHCTLGPYWGKQLGKSVLRGFQASARGGVVGVQLRGERVKLLGQAVTTLKGRLHV